MTHDSETCDYIEKHRIEGKTEEENHRCVKRYLARRVSEMPAAIETAHGRKFRLALAATVLTTHGKHH